jgi:hypothetical protein
MDSLHDFECSYMFAAVLVHIQGVGDREQTERCTSDLAQFQQGQFLIT